MSLSLDDLLTESMAQAAAKRQQKTVTQRVRAAVQAARLSPSIPLPDPALQWRAGALCEFWEQTVCDCGESFAAFMQYMVEYRQARGTATRWLKTEPEDTPDGMTATKVIYSTKEVSHCSICSAPPADAEIIFWGAPDSASELNISSN